MNYYLDLSWKLQLIDTKLVINRVFVRERKEQNEGNANKKAQPLSTDCAGKTFLCDAPYLSALSLSIKHKYKAFFKCLKYTLFYLPMQMQSLLAIAIHSLKDPPPHLEIFQMLLLKSAHFP